MRGVFVTGTDTGVGKTIVAATICAQAAARRLSVAAFKPVVTGLDEPPNEWPRDHELLAQTANCGQTPEDVSPHRYGPAVSPHLAELLAGEEIDPESLVAAARAEAAKAEALVVEGVGGLLVPLTEHYLVRDFAGELSLPLVIAGVDVVGVDLPVPMMTRLLAKARDSGASAPVARADATRLPLASRSVGAAFMCHVLHLVPRWPEAVGELVRVVQPGGTVLVDLGNPKDELDEMARYFQAAAGVERRHPGVENEADIDLVVGAFRSLGTTPRALPPIPTTRDVPPSALISMWEQNRFSWLWSIDESTRMDAVEATKRWAVERYGDLDAPVHCTADIVWRAFDVS